VKSFFLSKKPEKREVEVEENSLSLFHFFISSLSLFSLSLSSIARLLSPRCHPHAMIPCIPESTSVTELESEPL